MLVKGDFLKCLVGINQNDSIRNRIRIKFLNIILIGIFHIIR